MVDMKASKGISPIVATVLLIAFTVSVAGILSVWLTGFTQTTTETVSKKSSTELTCAYGGMSLSSLRFSSAAGRISANIENSGQISIGSISFQVFYRNGSTPLSLPLCREGSSIFNCSIANLSLSPREMVSVNVSAGTGTYTDIDIVRVYANCSNVFDNAERSDISQIN
jgi:flagellin-like protein